MDEEEGMLAWSFPDQPLLLDFQPHIPAVRSNFVQTNTNGQLIYHGAQQKAEEEE